MRRLPRVLSAESHTRSARTGAPAPAPRERLAGVIHDRAGRLVRRATGLLRHGQPSVLLPARASRAPACQELAIYGRESEPDPVTLLPAPRPL
jgi:hypothetical protein